MTNENWVTVTVNTLVIEQLTTWDQGRTTWDRGQTTWDTVKHGIVPNTWTQQSGTT